MYHQTDQAALTAAIAESTSTHETVHFELDGQSYEIDLSAADAGRLRERLAPYIACARPALTGGIVRQVARSA